MGKGSSIEWCDHTFNPWWGCVRVSPGCGQGKASCYAETFDRRVHGRGGSHWGPKAPRRFFGDAHWDEPLKWNRAAEAAGVRARVFCASMADVGEDREDLVPHRARLALLIQNTPWLDWLILTKRVSDLHRLFAEYWPGAWPDNVWVGCSVESQQYADERIPELLKIPAAVRFLSGEPLLGLLDLTNVRVALPTGTEHWNALEREYDNKLGGPGPRVDWVIAGGQSGPGAHPMHPDWARSLRDQCRAAGVAFLFKQWGEWAPLPRGAVFSDACDIVVATGGELSGGVTAALSRERGDPWTLTAAAMRRVGKHAAGRILDGRTWDQFPAGAPCPA